MTKGTRQISQEELRLTQFCIGITPIYVLVQVLKPAELQIFFLLMYMTNVFFKKLS